MASHWMRLSPQQAINWYSVPEDVAHHPEHAFYGLNLTEDDMRNGGWMRNREFFAVLSSTDLPQGLRLHIATIDGDLFGDEFYDNVLETDVGRGIKLNTQQAVAELVDILLQHGTAPDSLKPPTFAPISVDDLTAKGIQLEDFERHPNNHYYRELRADGDKIERVVKLTVKGQTIDISFHHYDFNTASTFDNMDCEAAFLDLSREGLWELALTLKKDIGAAP